MRTSSLFFAICFLFVSEAEAISFPALKQLLRFRKPAQSCNQDLLPRPKKPQVRHPYFYYVSNGQHGALLLGTMPIGVSASQLPTFILQALMKSNAAVFEDSPEIRDNIKAEPETPHELNVYFLIKQPHSETMSDLGWSKLKEFYSDVNVEDLKFAQPTYLFDLTLRRVLNKFAKQGQMDNELKQLVQDRGIPASGLVNRYPTEEPYNYKTLRHLLSGLEMLLYSLESGLRRAVSHYVRDYNRDADLESDSAFKSNADYYPQDNFTEARNADWTQKLIEQMEETKNLFFALHYRHLFGAPGLISLLKQRGYKVTRLYTEEDLHEACADIEALCR